MNFNIHSHTYFIGDLQGCYSSLTTLIERINTVSSQAQLIFVGDLVNRGPSSLTTLRAVRSLNNAKIVLGNHDLHLLAVAYGIRKLHRNDTLAEILNAPDRDVLLEWLRHQSLALLQDQHLIVHAGVLPQWSATKTLALAKEVETMLQSEHWLDFLRDMYANEPTIWDDALLGNARLRCIVNGLTRLRFCTAEGKMEFATKKGIDAALPDYLPWFDIPHRQSEDTTVVFGHWSTLGLLLRPNIIGLDTGCVWGGKLTAVRLHDRAILQVNCQQAQKPKKK